MNQAASSLIETTSRGECSTPFSETAAMTVSALRAALASAPALPLTVIWPDGDAIEPHFHVTEVGRVQKDFVDCGGTIRRTVTCLLQTWVGDDVDHRITAGKLLKALDHARPVLGDDDLPVELEYETCNVVQLKVAAVVATPEGFSLQLASKHTDCLAKELCIPAARGVSSGGCC